MASVYKRRKYAPVPPTAVIVEVPTRSGTPKRIARWTDAVGRTQEAEVFSIKGHGDRIIIGEFRCWYVDYQSEHGRRTVKAYADKAASVALGERLEKDAARRREGLIDQYDDHLKTPIGRHLDDFMATRPSNASSELYLLQVRNRIGRIIKGIMASRLHDLDPVAIDRWLNEANLFGHTRNEYVGNIKAFTKWAVDAKRLRDDPLATLRKVSRKKIKAVHPRRALSSAEVAELLTAAEQRPLLEALTVRRGDKKGQAAANVHPRVRAKLERLGRERRLCYLIAVWTGLRRSEIKALVWGDLRLESATPYVQLRAEATKAKRADGLSIHPQLLEALQAAKPADSEPTDRVVRHVPGMKAFRADLKMAGIDDGDADRGFVDFHSLRKTLSTMMASAKMSQRARQSHMRHTDPRLTEVTYMDERLLPVAEELSMVPPIPENEPTSTVAAAPAGAVPGAVGAVHMQCKTAKMTLDLTPPDYAGQEPIVELLVRGTLSQVQQIQRIGQALSPNDKTLHREAQGL